RMRDLEMNRSSEFGAVNELELVIARGAGLFVEVTPQYARRNFDGQWICKKMYGIGEGKLFENISGYTQGGFLASKESAKMDEASIKKGVNPEMFWTGYLTSKGKTDEEPDDVDEVDEHGEETQGSLVDGDLFTCNECGVRFIKYGNLLRHLDIGKHKIRPEKITLYDCALQLYKQKLEGIQAHNNTLKEVSEAVIGMVKGVDKCNEGWALRGKRKHITYSKKAKNFANKMFRLGDGSGRKMDPAEVERLMKENDQIKPYERMNAQQIRSYFGSLCKKQTNKRGKHSAKEMEEVDDDWEDLADEDVEYIDDFGRQLDDDIHEFIKDNLEEFFENTDEPVFD
ncbi:hypothetical protein PENTCL1PPCAC_16191, partial [Pristionchus entomophagus]